MKRILHITATAVMAAAIAAGCKEQRILYTDAEYVMFADSEQTEIIPEEGWTFSVPVVSTVATDYDRNFGVEILDRKSTAIERLHYRLESNTVTIKAGERSGSITVKANRDELNSSDTLNIAMRLIMPEAVKWDLYGDETNVKLIKGCRMNIEDFSGWCVVTSMFLYNYPGLNTSYQRLIYTEKHPSQDNTLILHNFLYDGYDVNIRFETDDLAQPWISMDADQVLSNEQSVFGTIYGDDHILVAGNPILQSNYNACEGFASLYISVYVEDLGDLVGYVTDNGDEMMCLNLLEWVSDEEADRLENEDGLKKRY